MKIVRHRGFEWMTKLEWAIGAVVLVIISLLATLEPF